MKDELKSGNFKIMKSNFEDALAGMGLSSGIIKRLEDNMKIRDSLPEEELDKRLRKVERMFK